VSREAAIDALLTLVESAYVWTVAPSRRLKLWSDVPVRLRPCCFLFEGATESYAWSNGALPRRTIEVKLFAYFNAKDPERIGASQINAVMDALDAAFQPAAADAALGRNTLGGRAYSCRIDNAPFKDPGDIDGDGLLVVPVKIVLP
jgi:hypothetical protein